MKKINIFILALFLIIPSLSFAEKAPKTIVDLAHSTLAAIGSDPVIVDAVNQENAKGKTLDQVKSMDEKWQKTAGIADYMKALMDSACGKHLKTIQAQKPFYAEIFVMDNLGAIVAMTDKTSDYWQGDEAKFNESINNGAGAVFIDEVEFDESSQSYLVQVSVPVKDGDKVIGAITFGIDVDQVN
ncbi:hypothetical protein JCM14469_40390 [Desulfatiferula olefinivorans]